MKVKISSEITIENPTPEVLSWCEKELILDNPLYKDMIKRGQENLAILKHVPKKMSFTRRYGNSIRIPFGCLYAIYPMIKNCELTTDFVEPHYTVLKDREINNKIKLYDYQKEAISRLLSAKGGILQAGCGAGKTITSIELIRKIGQRFLWIVSTKDLLRQAHKNFLDLYPDLDIGLITEGRFDIGRDGAISTIQTLSKMDPDLYEREFNILVVDECHKCASDATKVRMYDSVLRRLKCRYRYGLSATPFRSDTLSKTLYFNLGANPNGTWNPTFIVEREQIQTMEAMYLDFNVDTVLPFNIVKSDGTIDYGTLLTYLSENEDRSKAIVDKVANLAQEGRKIVVLSNRKKHCERMTEMLVGKGIKAVCVIGTTPDKKRKEHIDHPENWDVLVATTELLKEGIDIKALDTVVMTLPIKDKATIIQSCGRCERKMEGKKQPLYIFVKDVRIPYCLGTARIHRNYISNRT